MQKKLPFLMLSAGIVAISGCSRETNFARSFYSEAGSEIESSDFGNSTMSNTMLQSGERDYSIDLTRRFASDVPNTVNFAFNSAVLDADAQAALRKQADWIKQFPEVRFRVYGHTDLVGSAGYNKRLGLRRAQAAVAYLTSFGINRSRLEAVVSYGKTQPLVYTQSPERRNRRTVTEVSGFVASNPLILNGKYAEVIGRNYVKSAEPVQTQAEVSGAGEAAGSGG